MVKLKSVQESNAALRSTSSGQVAFFVGATSGIAFHTLTEFTRNSNRPKVYIVGRSDAKLFKIIAELETINPEGSYVPIRSEISLLKNVDAACEEYRRKEKRLDLLIMCPGYLKLSRQGTRFSIIFLASIK
jgi:NADP-dependent 3-hydroxy acid dehydrogenase YdfG